jgi:hypothetical protein
MGAELKPVGRAVATAKGHYPTADGRHATVLPGETFTVFEGLDKARWFTLLKDDAPAPAPVAPPPAPAEPNTLAAVASVERKRRAAVKAPTADPGDDIA